MVSGETIVRNLQHGLARAEALGGDAAMRVGLPARHVRARRADAADPAPRRARARGRVAGRAERGRRRPRSGGGRPTVRRCAPSTSTARTRTAATSRPIPDAARRACPRLRRRARRRRAPRRRHAADERLRPPPAPAVAGSRGRRGQRHPGRVPVRGHVAGRVRRASSRSTACSPGAASCGRAHAPTCSWAWRRTGSTCTRLAAHAERSLERVAEPLSALLLAPERLSRRAARRRLAPADPQQRARLVVRVQRRRGGRSRAGALPGGAPRRRGTHPRRRCGNWRRPSTPRPRRPSW